MGHFLKRLKLINLYIFFWISYFVNLIGTYAVFGLWRYSSLRERVSNLLSRWAVPDRFPLVTRPDVVARSFAGPLSTVVKTDFQSQTAVFGRRKVHTDRANAINYYDDWRVSIVFAAVASRANDANGRVTQTSWRSSFRLSIARRRCVFGRSR